VRHNVETMSTPQSVYLQPTAFIDSDCSKIVAFAQSSAGKASTEIEQAIALYYAVRDGVRYSPYGIQLQPLRFKASWVLEHKVGFCVQKSVLLAAAARALGIAARLGFADVRNHLSSPRLLEAMRTDTFVFHSYTQLCLDGRWVKATPAFNLELCRRFNVEPLAFDGKSDSLFQPFDREGRRHMEYVRDHGQFADLPFERMVRAFQSAYPHLFEGRQLNWPGGNFDREAA